VDVPTRRPVPEREFFRIGEVAEILGVPPSAVRFWKEQFPSHVRPRRTSSLQNAFSRRDLAVLALVRHLVHDEGLGIREAKDRLSDLLAAHGGDVGFIEMAQGELPLDGGVREAPEGRGFLAQLDGLRADLEAARRAVADAEARVATAEAATMKARGEAALTRTVMASLTAAVRQAVRELAAEADG
jgi:DNA-binding transcriptional MerR regulator